MRSPACALCFAQVHRPPRRLPRTAGRDASGTRAALSRAVRSAPPATQSPRRLRSAGFIGVDLPIFHTARIAYPTGRAGLGFSHPTQQAAGARMSALGVPFGTAFTALGRLLLVGSSKFRPDGRDALLPGADYARSAAFRRSDPWKSRASATSLSSSSLRPSRSQLLRGVRTRQRKAPYHGAREIRTGSSWASFPVRISPISNTPGGASGRERSCPMSAFMISATAMLREHWHSTSSCR